jgi:hypothetical protein
MTISKVGRILAFILTPLLLGASILVLHAASSISGGRDDTWTAIVDHDGHVHGYRRWFGAASSPSGEAHVADRMSVTPFLVTAGDDAFGSWVQILGSDDTPAQSGKSIFCPCGFQIAAYNQTNTVHFLQVAVGNSVAEAIAVGAVTDVVFVTGSISMPELHARFPAIRTGAKLWFRLHALGKEVAWISIYLGIHE